MEFDIIPITSAELKELSVVQMKMLRTAQQKKDELVAKAGKELEMYRAVAFGNGMKNSSLIGQKSAALEMEVARQRAIIADNLLYNMALNEPTDGGDVGGSDGDVGAGYIVDYTLNYTERYVIVRDFYLSIEDPNERMALYAADEVAKKYLDSYYYSLFDYLDAYSK